MSNLHTTIRTCLGEDVGKFDPRHIEAVLRRRKVEPHGIPHDVLLEEIEFSRVAVVMLGAERAEQMAQACGL